jgi:DNA topoisomerase-1
MNEACARTASLLGNTPAVCTRYYIHPRVIEAFAAGKLAAVRNARAKNRMSAVEVALARFLEGQLGRE